jgi:hypothetical protein
VILLGDTNWWLPRRLDRILPTIDFEGEEDVEPLAPVPAGRNRSGRGAPRTGRCRPMNDA